MSMKCGDSHRSTARRPTCLDVARRVGVSASTVSHALSGKRPISPKVCEQIFKAAADLGYRPNFAARSLSLKATQLIGLTVASVYNPSTHALIDCFARELRELGFRMLLAVTDGDATMQRGYLHDFATGMVDGLINLDEGISPEAISRSVPGLPSVTYLRSCETEFGRVHVDFAGGIREAVTHLWGLGHRQIGLISGPLDDPSAVARLEGYRQFYAGEQIVPLSRWMIEGNWRMESGEASVTPLVDQGCTAIVAANDLMALGAMRGAKASGLSVPDDLSIVGFDDIPFATIVDPQLTTVHMPQEELARATVQLLLDRMRGSVLRTTKLVRPVLIVRGSTTRLRGVRL